MSGSIVLLFLTGLVLFDSATPLLPGAFQFDADESIDGVHAERSRVRPPSATSERRPAVRTASVTAALAPRPPRAFARPTVDRGHRPRRLGDGSASPAPSDDH